MHDWQYVGERKQLMNDSDIQCPMQCGKVEKRLHYLHCQEPSFHTKRKKCLGLLQKQLNAAGTYPGITLSLVKIITEGFETNWLRDFQQTTSIDKAVLMAIRHQQQLGEHSLPKGYLHKSWFLAQLKWTDATTRQIQTWTINVITALHTYTISVWKLRNDILHKDAVKSKKARQRIELQQRVESLYKRGRANLTTKEKTYFALPVEQRQRKGIESMMLWIKLVEAIFRNRGQATQVKIDEWLTGSTPPDDWKDKYSDSLDGLEPKNGDGGNRAWGEHSRS